jgi:type IV pilus assembly protein PilA
LPRRRPLIDRLRRQHGFTLIELLAVMLVIGILAAIGIPQFLSQRQKGMDADAKSNVRNLVTHVESCFAQERNYRDCDGDDSTGQANDALHKEELGTNWGSAPGNVHVREGTTRTRYTARAISKNGGHTFDVTHEVGTTYVRACSAPGDAGCKTDSTW